MNKIAIVCALKDEASVNIANQLKNIGIPTWANYYEFDEDTVFLPLSLVKETTIIVLSKHASAAGKKSLTVHSLGNFGKAEYGGEEGKLCKTNSNICANYLRALNKKKEENKLEDFQVCMEVTHHGPFIDKEVVFIELGSSITEWTNKDLAKIIAEVVIESTNTLIEGKTFIGLGGTHYAPEFTKLILRENYLPGHLCPSYALEKIDENMLSQMIEKSKATEIVLDWKGLKKEKQKIVALCEKTGLIIKRV